MKVMGSYILMVVVTGDQEDAIEHLFQFKGWKYEKSGSMSREEFLQKHYLNRKGDTSSSNIHQTFSQPYLENQTQFANSYPSVTGSSECNMCDKSNGSIDMNTTQYNSMVDKQTSVTTLENSKFYQNIQEVDLQVSKIVPVRQESIFPVTKEIPNTQESDFPVTKNSTHNLDYAHFDISNAANKQYSQNSETTASLHRKTSHMKDTNTHEDLILQCNPVVSELREHVDIGSSKVAETDSSNFPEIDSHHKLDEMIYNENVKVKSSNGGTVDHHSNIDKIASNESIKGEVVSKVNDTEVMLDINMEAGFGPGNSISRLTDHADRLNVNDVRVQERDKLLLNDFDIICKFLKSILDFELDRQLILPKLEEILSIAKCLQNQKLLHEQVIASSHREEIKHDGRERIQEFRSQRYEKGINEMHSGGVCNSEDEKGIEDDDTEPIENNSPAASETCSNTDTEAEKEITDLKETKPEGTKVKVKTYRGINSGKTKWIKCEILNCHEGLNKSFELKSNYLIRNEGNSGGYRKQGKNENFVCKDESAKFRWTVNRNMRMHKYHRKCEQVPPDLDADSYSVLEKGFYCHDCQFIFKSKNKLILHKRLKNGYCLPDCIYCDADQQKDVYQCTKCPKCFQTKQMLERHEERHIQIYSCNLCILEFYTINDLKFHLRTAHTESTPPTFLCDLCGSEYKERKVLNAHRRFVHSDERPEVCTFCNKCFKTKSQLKNHLVTHKQVAELNLSCEICGKKFKRVATLKDHVRRHKKEFSFYCTICSKGFYRKYGLKEHMRVHTGDKPFDCKFCGFKSALSCNLVKHMKIHHKYSQK